MPLLTHIAEDLLGEEVLHLGLIAQHLEVRGLQQLRAAVMQLLPNLLLDPWVCLLYTSRCV